MEGVRDTAAAQGVGLWHANAACQEPPKGMGASTCGANLSQSICGFQQRLRLGDDTVEIMLLTGLLTPVLRTGSIIATLVVLFTGNYPWLVACAAAFIASFFTMRIGNAGLSASIHRKAAEAAAPYGRTVPPEVVRALWARDNSEFVALAQRYKADHPDIFVNLKIQCFHEACGAWARGEL